MASRAAHLSASFSTNDADPTHDSSNNNTTGTNTYHHFFAKSHPHSRHSIADDGRVELEGPPRKKPRLSLRPGKGIQTTLDAFTKPPNKITVPAPGAHVVQTINGVKTELPSTDDELLLASPKPSHRKTPQPQQQRQEQQQQAAKKEDRRSLRSQDNGPRLKSDLHTYFAGYESIVFDTSKEEEEFLTIDTALYITDDPSAVPALSPARQKNARRISVNGNAGPPPLTPQRSSNQQFNGSPVLSLDAFARNVGDNPEDPLTDELFLVSHRRAERKEKQLRNIEKERAMHERVQLERILAGLEGHDWLRVLGITGVTDSEAKKYESKRDYFIDEVKALIDKFKQWKEQEKKQRLEKEAAVAAQEDDEEESRTSGDSVEPPSSDLNASAARQLQQEAITALKSSVRASGKGKAKMNQSNSHPSTPSFVSERLMVPPAPPSPETPITSFYAKRHLRDAALGRSRHGRNTTAFGQPLPEMDEAEFVLPKDYLTEDTLRSNARERRRRKRESTTNNAVSKA